MRLLDIHGRDLGEAPAYIANAAARLAGHPQMTLVIEGGARLGRRRTGPPPMATLEIVLLADRKALRFADLNSQRAYEESVA